MRIVIDFDQTLVNSSKALHEIYLQETGRKEEYNPKHTWNFDGLFPKDYKKRVKELFHEKIFYENLFAFHGAIDVIKHLIKRHEVIICTTQQGEGVLLKNQWINDHLPFINNVIYMDSFDKSSINGDVFIDDKPECLNSVNGNFKCIWCYGDYLWNKDWKGERVLNWREIEEKIKILL